MTIFHTSAGCLQITTVGPAGAARAVRSGDSAFFAPGRARTRLSHTSRLAGARRTLLNPRTVSLLMGRPGRVRLFLSHLRVKGRTRGGPVEQPRTVFPPFYRPGSVRRHLSHLRAGNYSPRAASATRPTLFLFDDFPVVGVGRNARTFTPSRVARSERRARRAREGSEHGPNPRSRYFHPLRAARCPRPRAASSDQRESGPLRMEDRTPRARVLSTNLARALSGRRASWAGTPRLARAGLNQRGRGRASRPFERE
jgi:hypothetical protein